MPDAGELPFIGHAGEQCADDWKVVDALVEGLPQIDRGQAPGRVAPEVGQDVIAVGRASLRGWQPVGRRGCKEIEAALQLLLQRRLLLIELCETITDLPQTCRGVDHSINSVTHRSKDYHD